MRSSRRWPTDPLKRPECTQSLLDDAFAVKQLRFAIFLLAAVCSARATIPPIHDYDSIFRLTDRCSTFQFLQTRSSFFSEAAASSLRDPDSFCSLMRARCGGYNHFCRTRCILTDTNFEGQQQRKHCQEKKVGRRAGRKNSRRFVIFQNEEVVRTLLLRM